MADIIRTPHRAYVRTEPSWEAQQLAAYLETVPENTIVPYTVLSTIANGKEVQGKHRYILATARRMVQREKRLVFRAVTNQGLMRLSDTGMAKTLEYERRGVERKAKKSLAVAHCIQTTNLDDMTRHKVVAYAAAFGAVAFVACKTQVRALELLSREQSHVALAPEDVVKLFAKAS